MTDRLTTTINPPLMNVAGKYTIYCYADIQRGKVTEIFDKIYFKPIIMMETRYRYNVITDDGEQQPWTGIFEDKAAADRWYNIHGKKWELEGKTLIRIKCQDVPRAVRKN